MVRLLSIRCGFAFAIAALCAGGAATAQPMPHEDIEIGISTDEIAVESNFAGADITVFGAIEGVDPDALARNRYDIVVALEGPKLEATVRKKQRVFGIWINRRSVSFRPLPTSYSVSSTRPVDELTDFSALRRYSIGSANLQLRPSNATSGSIDVDEFREALRALKRGSGLYQRDFHGIDFVSSSLFQASIRLPANIPVGVHTVRAYLFKDGDFIAQKDLDLRVVKTGIEQYINTSAHEYPFFYGLFAVFLAGVTGWLGSVVFRRD